jgi:hypothetical protein
MSVFFYRSQSKTSCSKMQHNGLLIGCLICIEFRGAQIRSQCFAIVSAKIAVIKFVQFFNGSEFKLRS